MINKNEFTKYLVISILMAITITTITSLASQNTIQVNVAVQGVGPLGNASITYMEFVQSYTTQMLQAYGTTTTNNEGIALIPQPPPPLPGKEDIITITINATVNGSPVFRTYTFYLTNENFTNQINITISTPRINNSTSNESMFLIAIIIVIIVVLIVIIIALMRKSRK
ncbi:hypothetical protein [Vulcanisaeta sp. JCM 14467]|uniref:hypothetical protein n=1 Tax=Vulcanisaeta sp. JCM 14467 TaxID=1295370 RepID=UPI0006CF7A41|nr:hypothetical protein [Vulcanisaeta sp. JCM 14467]